jgi:tRNA A37 N6-isopentenylltransferase MiaA
MADQEVKVVVTVDANQAQTSLKQTASAAEETAKSTAKVGEAAKTAQPKIGDFGSALGLAGQAVGQLVPGLGQVVSIAGSATGVIQGLTTAGLGPLGMAVGVVSVAVTAGVKLWQDYTTEQENAARKIRETAIPALSDLRKAFLDARDAAAENAEIQARVRGGGGDIGDIAAVIERTAQQRTQLATELADLNRRRVSELSSADINRIEELNQLIVAADRQVNDLVSRSRRVESQLSENALLNAEQARRRAAIAAMVEEAEGQGRIGATPGGRGGGGRAAAAEAPATTPMGYDSEAAQRELARLEEDMATEADVRRMMRELEIEEQSAAKDRSIEIATQLNEERARLEKERMDEQLRLAEEQAARMQEINDAVFSALESAFSSSVSAWLDGSKSMGEAALGMVRDVARALTTEAIVQGLKQTALGISALAVGSPTAAGHFAAAAKWAAVGVAAGVVGASSGAFGGGGGGGGAPAAATGGPALTPGASEGAGTTVVINWGSSGLVYAADRAQLGRDISGMISEAHGRLGRGM